MKTYESMTFSCFRHFACKGPACKNTCCQGWGINFTKEEFKKWKKYGVAEKCCGSDCIAPCGASLRREILYGKIVLDEDGKCPLLTEDGLCGVQVKYGPDMLSDVCQEFPRIDTFYENFVIRGFTLGCERVVEILLEEKNHLELDVGISKIKDKKNWSRYWNQNTRRKHPVLWHFYDIQTLCLLLLQAEGDTLENRMILLGIGLQGIRKLCEEEKYAAIPMYIESFLESAQDISVGDLFEGDALQNLAPLYYSANLLFFHTLLESQDKPYIELMHKIEERLGWKKNAVDDDSSLSHLSFDSEYYEECRKRFAKRIKGQEYFLENIMAAFMLSLNIPFHDLDYSIWDNYIYFVWAYSAVKFLLSVCLDEDSTDEEMVQYVTIFFRKLGHNGDLLKKVIADFKEHGDSLAHLCMVLKNC